MLCNKLLVRQKFHCLSISVGKAFQSVREPIASIRSKQPFKGLLKHIDRSPRLRKIIVEIFFFKRNERNPGVPTELLNQALSVLRVIAKEKCRRVAQSHYQ
jgi:hypothetical protein